MAEMRRAIGIDIGGTKIEAALVDASGSIGRRLRFPTDVRGGVAAVRAQLVRIVRELKGRSSPSVEGIGVGVAGQVDGSNGIVNFAPNLNWHDVPLQAELGGELGTPCVVVNDVRAAAWGEWLHGAGQGCKDLVCVFVGTGIGGAVVGGGRMLDGCTGCAAELGHVPVRIGGPACTCGGKGCLEALAGGWAIAREAQAAARRLPSQAGFLLRSAGENADFLTARLVIDGARAGDPLCERMADKAVRALIAGVTGFVNAFNPCRVVLGGGIVEGWPELLPRVEDGVRKRALAAAVRKLRFDRAALHGDAGVIGAASLALRETRDPETEGAP